MERSYYSAWNSKSSIQGLHNVEEYEELKVTLPSIPQPQTPQESMEFLARSWSISASEITKAIADKQKQFFADKNHNSVLEPTLQGKGGSSVNARRTGSFRKWFHKEPSNGIMKKKDRARVENARVHSALSVAALAAALAASAAAENSSGSASKLSSALASASEILASHCIEMAELAGANHDCVASVVKSAVGIRSPSDLMTLTAAAATALRGEAAIKARLPKEPRKNAAISPYDRLTSENHLEDTFHGHLEDQGPPCVGELLQLTQKGVLRWKHVCIYLNKKSQIVVSIKSKHVGGAFSKKNKCVVYGVCDESSGWPYMKERDRSDEVFFGLKTGRGLLEFKCKNKMHKQRWVDEIQHLLHRVNCVEETGISLQCLSISNSI